MIRLVQIGDGRKRCVAIVDEPQLLCLAGATSIYGLVDEFAAQSRGFEAHIRELTTGDALVYDEVYAGRSAWKLLAPIDVPSAPERVLVSGTGLTHLGSAKDRQNMHLTTALTSDEPMTDSMRMFRWGLEGGRPSAGEIGVAPEWFYKGDGSVIEAPFAALTSPAHAEDGGEEAELAGVYVISKEGTPVRVGVCAGNEFADHKFERRNYLNLAGSKLRSCSLGPELVIGGDFHSVRGVVSIERDGRPVWSKQIESGEDNMAHTLANLEHHHFKFAGHRTPGHVHVHFFGAPSLSFGEGFDLQDGDWMQVSFEGYGRPLRNVLRVESRECNTLVRVNVLS